MKIKINTQKSDFLAKNIAIAKEICRAKTEDGILSFDTSFDLETEKRTATVQMDTSHFVEMFGTDVNVTRSHIRDRYPMTASITVDEVEFFTIGTIETFIAYGLAED